MPFILSLWAEIVRNEGGGTPKGCNTRETSIHPQPTFAKLTPPVMRQKLVTNIIYFDRTFKK